MYHRLLSGTAKETGQDRNEIAGHPPGDFFICLYINFAIFGPFNQ